MNRREIIGFLAALPFIPVAAAKKLKKWRPGHYGCFAPILEEETEPSYRADLAAGNFVGYGVAGAEWEDVLAVPQEPAK